MKKQNIFQACILLFLFAQLPVYAQKLRLDNVLKVHLKSNGPIIQDDATVKGYYFFYQVDNINGKDSKYLLKILDANLKEVNSQEIIASRDAVLTEATYNGSHLMMEFYDLGKKEIILKKFDPDAKLSGTYKIEDMNTNYQTPIAISNGDELRSNYLFPVAGRGFVFYKTVKNKKFGYQIKFYSNSGQTNWSYASPTGSSMLENALFLTADEDIIVSMVNRRSQMISTDAGKNYLLGVDATTGKKRFEIPLQSTSRDLVPMNGFFNTLTGNITILGQAYKHGEAIKGKSIGLFAIQVSREGERLSESFVSWEKDVAEFLPISQKGKIQDVGYLYFHTIQQNNQGMFFAVAEQYRKAADGLGIAAMALGAGGGSSKIVIEDMMVFTFSPEFELEGVNTFDKGKTTWSIPGISGGAIQGFGMLMKMFGVFDYSYTQSNSDKSILTTGYIDYENFKKEKNQLVYGAIINRDGELSVDKITLETDATNLSIYAAKSGYVMIAEYHRKTKSLDLRLEKINY